jgi:hypothetical protein
MVRAALSAFVSAHADPFCAGRCQSLAGWSTGARADEHHHEQTQEVTQAFQSSEVAAADIKRQALSAVEVGSTYVGHV